MSGRQKGNAAEREVAKLCQKWWDPHEHAEFIRTPLSGGWSTPQVRSGFKACGDLMTTALTWPFCVEVKRREGWSWVPFIRGKASPIWAWWLQTVKAARLQSAEPMLWFRHNRTPWWVMLRQPYAMGKLPQAKDRACTWDHGELLPASQMDNGDANKPCLIKPGTDAFPCPVVLMADELLAHKPTTFAL